MPPKIHFDPNNQGDVATAATALVSGCEKTLPKVPWFSNSGQQEAFKKIVGVIEAKAATIDADEDARETITFWALSLLYANSKGFRLATASVRNWGAHGLSPMAKLYTQWAGSNVHPGQAVGQELARREMEKMIAAGIPEKIISKTSEIAKANNLSEEQASSHFQQLLAETGKRHMDAGLPEHIADRRALEEILGLNPK